MTDSRNLPQVALRDFGLLLAALALWRLAAVYDTRPLPWRHG